MPQRVQLRRAKGWRKPPGVVVVARPSRWGNPLTPVGGDKAASAIAFADALTARRRGALPSDSPFHAYPSDEEIREQLAGRDLACWCRLDQPCHADALLAIANR